MFSVARNVYKFSAKNAPTKHVITLHRRCKHKETHWSNIAKKKFPKDRALEHYDDFYKTVYGEKWPSIRIALLSPHKYCAVVNNYSDTDKIITNLENQGALNMRTLFEIEANRIQENKESDTNDEDQSKIYKLDKKMELLMLSKRQAELNSLYPQNEDGTPSFPERPTDASRTEAEVGSEDLKRRSLASLKTSLEEADFDEHRMIDPSSGISAGLYEFIPATKLKGMEDWVPESQHYSYYKESDFPVTVTQETDLHFPENLNVYVFERGNISSFPSPKRGSTGVFSYYLLDGGSVLPVLALGLEPGDRVLDMCSAPGGKALIMLQTLYPECVVCNDIQQSRTARIHSVMEQYFYDLNKRKEVMVTQRDGRCIDEKDAYNKILVDVPCTTDRHSVHENDNNIFKAARTKERLKLPETQAELLFNALKLVRCGGTVVYSTCSLSPIQNDGVVHMALRRIWEETNVELEVRDMTLALEPAECVYRLGGRDLGLKYGHLVMPFLPNNFGPLYFCKIVRTK